MTRERATIDGNEAVAHAAYRLSEVVAIYPITPSSPMAELADQWSVREHTNIWGGTPRVQQLQSEGGAAGAIHGSLQAGALTTTFTASQGLLLMIPNMYKIAGELTSAVFHVAARSVAAQALSIFGDHSDVMAARATGFGMLFASSVQEAHDLSVIAHAATLKSRVPFLHVMDGFRTSHELNLVELLSDDDLRALIDDDAVRAHRARGMTPLRPVLRGTAQNPDVFFQARETVNPYYLDTPDIVASAMDAFAQRTGRRYRPFDWVGPDDAERVVVAMGSGCETLEDTVRYLNARGEKVGAIKVRLFRPFDAARLVAALPRTVRSIAVLDRTKEPGGAGEPLYQDVVTAVVEAAAEPEPRFETSPRVIGGRYGLSSKEFTPAMAVAVFEELGRDRPKNHFTVGVHDDVTATSLAWDPSLDIEQESVTRAVFWGLGSDGTVGANKNTVKIIADQSDLYAQGYFVYDSKKAGARTVSHLRFGPDPIRSTWLIDRADFIGVHQFGFLERYDPLAAADRGATLLLNAPFPADEVWAHLPRRVQEAILDREIELHAINAYEVADRLGLGNRINTIMQTCFFALSGVLPKDEAIASIKDAIRSSYGKRGEAVVRKNFAAVDAALENMHRIRPGPLRDDDAAWTGLVPGDAPAFVRDVTATLMAERGDSLPVSALPVDGTYPTGTARFEKRNIAQEVPVWDPDVCIQCGKCVLVCPHAVIRAKLVGPDALDAAPDDFLTAKSMWRDRPADRYTLQVAVEDCTGCTLCVEVCPAKNKAQVGRKAINMEPQLPERERGREHWNYFLSLPETPKTDDMGFANVKNAQLLLPLFEFSGACAGCGETPYLKLLSQLFGDRSIIANATGCSSIYGGNLPTTPWTTDAAGRGPAWNNSLFEDNAEFGMGMRLALDARRERARELLREHADRFPAELVAELSDASQTDEASVVRQRERVVELQSLLAASDEPALRDLASLAESLIRTDVWIVGGDGWAYDIGYGGLDHVLASGADVNVLVLDTEVYSNTGGQSSKATSLGAVAKFAAGGKRRPKKDLGRMIMSYGDVYVAQIAMGANDGHTVKVLHEAASYPGPSLIIAYSHCIAHGIDMAKGMQQQKLAAESGYWPLFRYDPRRAADGANPFQLDSRAPKRPFREYAANENRFRLLEVAAPDEAAGVFASAQEGIELRWRELERLAKEAPLPTTAPDTDANAISAAAPSTAESGKAEPR